MKDTRSHSGHSTTNTSAETGDGNAGEKRFSAEHGLTFEETRRPTKNEMKYLEKYSKTSLILSYVMYALVAALIGLELLLLKSGEDALSLYVGGFIGIAVGLWVAKRQLQIGQAKLDRKKLIRARGEFDAVSGYNTDYALSSIPLIPSPPFAKVARQYRGEELTIEGYLSEDGGVLYELAVPELDLSVQRAIEAGEISV